MPTLGGFNWFDIVLFILVGFGLTVGYTQGLLRQIIGLAGLYIATIIATQYYISFSNFLRFLLLLAESRLVDAAAFFVILLGVSAIMNFLAADAYRMTKLKMFPLIDQLGGSVLGVITIAIMLTLILPIISFVTTEPLPYFDPVRSGIVQGMQTSRLMPIFQAIKPTLLNAISPWIPGGLPSIFSL